MSWKHDCLVTCSTARSTSASIKITQVSVCHALQRQTTLRERLCLEGVGSDMFWVSLTGKGL